MILARFLTFLIAFCPLFAFSQSDVSFYVDASSRKVVLGTNFSIDFVMNNFAGQDFKAPAFENFTVISGPNQTSSYQNVNGQVSQEFKLSYTLRPLKKGVFTIGAASCMYDGKKLSTAPFKIEVLERDDKSLQAMGLPTDKDIFVRMELPKDSFYLGEKIELNYKLYTRKSVRSYEINSESDFSGFYERMKPRTKGISGKEEIDGTVYQTQILSTKLLYPQKTGTFEIEPSNLTLRLPDERRRSNFFFSADLKPFPVVTNDIKITVVDLPEKSPKSFSGAVGNYSCRSEIDKNSLSTDDAFKLSMTISGNGDPNYLLPPKLTHIENFDFYDPNTSFEDQQVRFGELQTMKTFEFLVVPLKSGNQLFIPEFSYFDPDKKEFVTLKQDSFRLEIQQGKNPSKRDIKIEETESRSISGLMDHNGLKKSNMDRYYLWILYFFIILYMLGFSLILFRKRQLDIEAAMDPRLKKRKKAKSIADQRLSSANQELENGNSRSFFDEINKAMTGFISDKFHIQAAELSRENLRIKLSENNVSAEWIKRIDQILDKAELALFAGKSSNNMESCYKEAKEIINELNKL